MTTVSGIPRMTWHGNRYTVIMWTGPTTTRAYYTFNQFAASLCEEAYRKKQSITIQAEETGHGWQIFDVSLDGQQQEAS